MLLKIFFKIQKNKYILRIFLKVRQIKSCIKKISEKLASFDFMSFYEICRGEDLNTVKTLYPKISDQEKNEGLHEAATYNRTDTVEFLLNKGVRPDYMDALGTRAPLHFASQYGNVKMIEMLLLKGANIDILNIYSFNALFIAVSYEKIESVKILIEYGINFKVKTFYGETPLQHAKRIMDENVKI